MRIASVTMAGQFPDGIDLHARNLRWALSEDDHIYIVTSSSYIKDYHLRDDARTTYIDFGECRHDRMFFPFWKEFPRILRERGIAPEWFLFMEQDIWFCERIAEDPPPGPREIRNHLPLQNYYHSVMCNNQLYHPRVWEGGMLFHAPLVRRAIDFGIDFSAHANLFIERDRAYWESVAGGTVSLGEYEQADTMDEFGLYCALAEKTRATHCPRAIHLQGPEALHRLSPELYHGREEAAVRALAERASYYFCVHAALAVYFIAGNCKIEADWKRIQRRFRPEFEKLIPTGKAWMKAEEYQRLERIVAGY